MKITCDCCGHETDDWRGFYCRDTPPLEFPRIDVDAEAIRAHNESRVWLCTPCCRHLLREILREEPRRAWQPYLERARANFRPWEEEEEP